VAERQILLDAVGVGFMDEDRTAQATTAFGTFGLTQMPPASPAAQDLARGRYFEALGHGLFRFDAFGTSHKFNLLKKSAHYR
jgi:hypothetical protein